MHTETNPLKGIILSLISYLFVSLVGISEKSISPEITLPTILFFQNLICLICVGGNLLKHDRISLIPNNKWVYFVRISTGLGCYATLFYLIGYISVSEALLYQYSATLWIPFVMMVWLKVRMPKRLWSGILVGFVGILFVLKPQGSSLNWVIATVGLMCSLFQAISVVAIRRLYDEPVDRVLFYYFLTGTIVMGGMAFHHWPTIAMTDLILLVGVGVFTYLSQQFFAHGSLYAHPSTLAPICYTCILYSGILGWFFWNEIPDMSTTIGMMFVVTGCLMTMLMTKKPKKSLILESELT